MKSEYQNRVVERDMSLDVDELQVQTIKENLFGGVSAKRLESCSQFGDAAASAQVAPEIGELKMSRGEEGQFIT